MMNYNIVLIGFMGTGKTTIASYLQDVFGMTLVETDKEIEEQEGKSVSQIFEEKGEDYFRDRESALLKEYEGEINLVISCGGGMPLREENVKVMKEIGFVVLLTASPKEIMKRLKGSEGRPLLKDRFTEEGIQELMDERKDKYEAAADLIVDTDHRNPAQICGEMITRLEEKSAQDV